eukprot:scaffold23497_cov106-Cylindrotheca_fusiformis.AAC.5
MGGEDIENASAKPVPATAVVDKGPTFDEQRLLNLIAKQDDARKIADLKRQLAETRFNAELHALHGSNHGGGVNMQMGGQTTAASTTAAASSSSGGEDRRSDSDCDDYLCMLSWKCACTIIAGRFGNLEVDFGKTTEELGWVKRTPGGVLDLFQVPWMTEQLQPHYQVGVTDVLRNLRPAEYKQASVAYWTSARRVWR